MYAGRIAATPEKSIVPVSTIGGEPGGRVPIVVADKGKIQGEKPPLHEKQTSTIGIKAEPGPNIFAGDPKVGAQSQGAPDQPFGVQNMKDVKTVITSSTETSAVKDTTTPSSGQASSSLDSQSSGSSVSESSSLATKTTPKEEATTVEASDDLVHRKAGPLLEDEQEADRAASELFPDAL